MWPALLSHSVADFRPGHFLPGLMAGLIAGMLVLAFSISFAALIFSGDLSPYVPIGIGLALTSALVFNITIALGSSVPTAVAGPQDAFTAIMAITAASIASVLTTRGSPEQILPTILVAIALASLLIGACFLALGVFRLGLLIRFIPYPVIAGFLAGLGWLLVVGSVSLLTGIPLSVESLGLLLRIDIVARLLPGVLLAVALLAMLRRSNNSLILPATVLAAFGLFYGTLWLTHTSLAEATSQGWLLGSFPADTLWQPLTPAALTQVNWSVLAGQVGNLVTLPAISAIGFLLNLTGIELETHRDVDVDRELRVMGIANLVAGAGSGLGGYHWLIGSVIGDKARANGRLVGITVALLSGVALWQGAALLQYIP
ncbi:MAG: SulP family inorganic anion transporter, partial [Chloroflexota bacterium]|nr:SulP family inorganic anion transporter [Chloroflexota bacterium]